MRDFVLADTRVNNNVCGKKMWDDMPDEIRDLVFAWRTQLYLQAIVCIQTHWRTYRTRMLLKRFIALRYLHTFREWNPSAIVFLKRTRL